MDRSDPTTLYNHPTPIQLPSPNHQVQLSPLILQSIFPRSTPIHSAHHAGLQHGTLCPSRPRRHNLRQQTPQKARPRPSRIQTRIARHPHRPLRNALPHMVLLMPEAHHHRPRCSLQRRKEKSRQLLHLTHMELSLPPRPMRRNH